MTQARRQQWVKHVESWENLCTNPSFETDAANWTSFTLGTVTRTNTESYLGGWSLLAECSGGATAAQAVYFGGIGTLGSDIFSARCAVRNRNLPSASTLVLNFYWLGGVNADASSGIVLGNIGTAGQWREFSGSFQADYNDRTAVYIYVATAAVSGEGFYLDGVTISKTTHPAPIFDGDSPGAYWLGTAHASRSILIR